MKWAGGGTSSNLRGPGPVLRICCGYGHVPGTSHSLTVSSTKVGVGLSVHVLRDDTYYRFCEYFQISECMGNHWESYFTLLCQAYHHSDTLELALETRQGPDLTDR